jgi:hypothetical protein
MLPSVAGRKRGVRGGPDQCPDARYDMGHVITPLNAKETLGYHQMDLFVPIVYRGG